MKRGFNQHGTRDDEAAAWHVRLNSDGARETDFAAFAEWVSAPLNRDAYDRIDRMLADIESDRPALERALAEEAVVSTPQIHLSRRYWLAGGAAAAVGAFAYILVRPASLEWSEYSTGATQTQEVRLADGSIINLNRNSSLKAAMNARVRRVIMNGEATFDVKADATRPFVIEAGGERVRVIGTEFNVLHYGGATTVTVRRGVVEVAAQTQTARIGPGRQCIARGSQLLVGAADPESVFAWRIGRLVYANTPLAQVAEDLSRYYLRPVRTADAATAAIPFSGVLVLDGEEEIVARLEAFLPIEAARESDATVLRRKRQAP